MSNTQGRSSTGLDANVAALLAYVLGWVTGLVFFLIEKDSTFVRFHALQSIYLSVAVIVAQTVAGIARLGFLVPLIGLLAFGLWIVMLVQAYQGRWFKLPVVGDIAARQSGAPGL